jgi:hypothetical protein
MTVENKDVVDLVSVDPLTGMVYLSLVEEREWGEAGELLPALQDKLNTYLEYVENGQLLEDYPDLAGSSVTFRLHYLHEPTSREREFMRIVVQQHLVPRRIGWEQQLISQAAIQRAQ